MNKRFAILLILILTASSLTAVKATHASIAKPSVPEFTIKFVDSSYDIPTTYSIDPYTGKNATQEGYHVEQKNVEVRIKNQPFTPFWIQDSSSGANYSVGFYYNIRFKGHFSEDWRELYLPYQCPAQDSVSEYTVIPLGTLYTWGFDIETEPTRTVIPSGGQIEFQVEAFFGHHYYSSIPDHPLAVFSAFAVDETSGWSDPQSMTIGNYASAQISTTSPPQDSTVTPDQSQNSTSSTNQSDSRNVAFLGLDWAQLATLTLLAVIAVLLVIAVVYLRRRSTKST